MSLVTTSLFGQLVLLPIPAQTPVKERLDWLTDVIGAEDSSEERHQVRNSARRNFGYNIPVSAEEYARAFNVVYETRASAWAVPMWTEAQQLGSVSAGLSTLPATTDNYDFRDDSLALLWSSPRDWQLIEIETVTPGSPGSLDLYGTTNAFDNAYLLPVRRGHIIGQPVRRTNSYNAEFALSFDLEDNRTLSVSAPTQYLSNDVYFDEWLLGGSEITDNLVQRVDMVDEQLGAVSYRSPWTNMRVSRSLRKVLETPAEVFAFRQFLDRRAGKYRAFWQPSFDSDLRVTSTGSVTDVLRVYRDDYLVHSNARDHIAIQDSSGAWYARTISNAASASASEMNLTLDSAINVDASDILRVSYLGLKRLESDKVELSWPGGGVCEVSVRVLELSP